MDDDDDELYDDDDLDITYSRRRTKPTKRKVIKYIPSISDFDTDLGQLDDFNIQEKRIQTISDFETEAYEDIINENPSNISVDLTLPNDDEEVITSIATVLDPSEDVSSIRRRKKRDKEELDE